MSKKVAWVMSESDTFELLNAIDDRLSSSRLDERQHDVLGRLRWLLEEDLPESSTPGLPTEHALTEGEVRTI